MGGKDVELLLRYKKRNKVRKVGRVMEKKRRSGGFYAQPEALRERRRRNCWGGMVVKRNYWRKAVFS